MAKSKYMYILGLFANKLFISVSQALLFVSHNTFTFLSIQAKLLPNVHAVI